jgi:hypothetical protein
MGHTLKSVVDSRVAPMNKKRNFRHGFWSITDCWPTTFDAGVCPNCAWSFKPCPSSLEDDSNFCALGNAPTQSLPASFGPFVDNLAVGNAVWHGVTTTQMSDEDRSALAYYLAFLGNCYLTILNTAAKCVNGLDRDAANVARDRCRVAVEGWIKKAENLKSTTDEELIAALRRSIKSYAATHPSDEGGGQESDERTGSSSTRRY